MSRRTRKNREDLKSLNVEIKPLVKPGMNNINLLLFIKSNVTGKKYKFPYTSAIGPTYNLEGIESSIYPLIKYSPKERGIFIELASVEQLGNSDEYKWPPEEEMPDWDLVQKSLKEKLKQLFSKGTLLKIPNTQKKDLYDGLEVTSYELKNISDISIPSNYESIFRQSPFQFIIAPGRWYDKTVGSSFKDKLFIIANVFLKGNEITKEVYEKKNALKIAELKEEKIKLDKMNDHEKNIYMLLKKTRNGLTNTCQYHLDELKYILLELQGYPPTKFEKRLERLNVELQNENERVESTKAAKKAEEIKEKAQVILIRKSVLKLFKEYNESTTEEEKEEKVEEINKIKENNIDNQVYKYVNRNKLLYSYYHTLIRVLKQINNNMKKAKEKGEEVGILKFNNENFIFVGMDQPTTENIEDIKKTIEQIQFLMPAKSGGRKTRKNRKNY